MKLGGRATMRMGWPFRALTRLWDWVIPGLIALDPPSMAYYAASSTGATRD